MPKDFSKMFAKRLSEFAYKQLKSYLAGKLKFTQVGVQLFGFVTDLQHEF